MEVEETISDLKCNANPKSATKKKPGIVYLSTLPPFMNVTKVKEIFENYDDTKKKKPAIHFSEGWIEFKSKKVAKWVSDNLNNTQICGKKRSKFYDHLWNIKYLPRFKWTHLGERLAYERAVHKQRLRTEIAQAKREANFFSASLARKKKVAQNTSEFEIVPKPPKSEDAPPSEDRTSFLKSLFA